MSNYIIKKKKLVASHEVSISIVDIEECGAFFSCFRQSQKGATHWHSNCHH